MFSSPPTLLFLTHLLFLVNAGDVTKGGACNIADNRLQIGTNQFYSDCDSETYCNASSSTCELKGCRKDVFPFGYAHDPHLPPLCLSGQFCPDEEDACQAQMPPGSACQLNRDDQCAPPPNWQQLADTSNRGLNVNGSVCLNNICMWANVTSGETCVVENTAYIAYGSDGLEWIDIVSRGNCAPGLYCDSQQLQCLATKDLGVSCSADKECSSYNCMASGVCGKSTSSPNHFDIWVYVLVAIGIFGGMFGTLIGLFIVHRRKRDEERKKRVQYWQEQNTLRTNILQMRDIARMSLLDLTQDQKLSKDGYTPVSPSAPVLRSRSNTTSSNRRGYFSDRDDEGVSVEVKDSIMMQPL